MRTIIGQGNPDGLPATANPISVWHMTFAPNGDLYVAEYGGTQPGGSTFATPRLLRITPDGVVFRVAGTGNLGNPDRGAKAVDAPLNAPVGVAIDGKGNIYVADQGGNRVHLIDTQGVITTFAGTGEGGYSGDGGKATETQFGDIWNVAADGQGNRYVSDGSNHRVRKIDKNGIVTTFAGNGEEVYGGDGGAAVDAGIPGPDGVVVAPDGSVIICDTTDARVRKVTPDGKITTIAGTGEAGYSGDGGKATDANISQNIENAGLDAKGNIYLADGKNNVIRVVDVNGIIDTFAGTGNEGFNGDGKGLKETNISEARDLYVDSLGNIIFAENDNISRVRIILINP